MSKPAGPRVFTLAEANALIPELKASLSHLRAQRERIWKADQKKAVEELSWLREDGTINPRAKDAVARMDKVLAEAVKKFEEELERFNEMSVQLKDLDEGLVDFFAERGGKLVYLCWKEGEEKISFWHEVEAGFAGRTPLQQF